MQLQYLLDSQLNSVVLRPLPRKLYVCRAMNRSRAVGSRILNSTHIQKEKLALSLSLSLIIPLLLHWRSCIRKTKKRESRALHIGKCVGTGIVFLLQKSRGVSRVSIGLEIVY